MNPHKGADQHCTDSSLAAPDQQPDGQKNSGLQGSEMQRSEMQRSEIQNSGIETSAEKAPAEELSLEQWLTLNAMSGIGPATLATFKAHNISLKALASGDITELENAGVSERIRSSVKSPDRQQVERDVNWLNSGHNRRVLPITDPDYPPLLAEICSGPVVLYCEGNVALLNEPLMAIVGSRACSVYGQKNARHFARDLALSGWGIVSGMAVGIDSCAHQGCMEAGGRTVAVLGTGLLQPYPKRNHRLRDDILANDGCLVSELPVHVPPKAENFPRRNRVISGLSFGTLVVEAALKSGSLITARYANEQNREVFAIPGQINNPHAKGCHQLIKNGAKLVENVEEINEEFLFLLQSVAEKRVQISQKKDIQCLASDQLLASVDYEATCLDVVVQRSRLPVSEVTAQLLEYELRGLVASVPGGYIRLGE